MPVLDRSALEDLPGMDFLAAALGGAQPKAGAAADTSSRAMSGRFSDRRRCGTGVLARRGGVRPTPASPCESNALSPRALWSRPVNASHAASPSLDDRERSPSFVPPLIGFALTTAFASIVMVLFGQL